MLCVCLSGLCTALLRSCTQSLSNLLKLYYVGSLRSLSTINYFELNSLSLFQRLEAFSGQTRVVYEYILSCLIGDESVSLLVVKPLYCTFHYCILQKTIVTEIDYNGASITQKFIIVN